MGGTASLMLALPLKRASSACLRMNCCLGARKEESGSSPRGVAEQRGTEDL